MATNQSFVQSLYANILVRTPSTTEVNYWTGKINLGEMTQAQVLETFVTSAEAQGNAASIFRLYQSYFGRVPSADEVQFHLNAMNAQGAALITIAQQFSEAPEFATRFGADNSNADFVTNLYQNVLGRSASQAEIDYYVARLTGGESRGSVALSFNESPEFKTNYGPETNAALANAGVSDSIPSLDTLEQQGAVPLATLTNELITNPGNPGNTATLTNGVDVVTANIFNAPRGFTPGGDDQINTLNDDDVLTGTGDNPTLNFTYADDTDLGVNPNITPTLIGIQTINVDIQGTQAKTLDLQDATGVTTINVSRVNANPTATVQNITAATADLSVNNSSAPGSVISFTYLASALAGTTDAVNVTANNIDVATLRVEENNAAPTEGFETINLSSTGSTNRIRNLQAEDVRTLNITGAQNLRVDAFTNAAGSLNTINGATATGNLDINLNGVLSATADGTSGTNIALAVTTGTGADTIRITADTIGTTDTINGGDGNDTLALQSAATNNFTPATSGAALVSGIEAVTMTRTDDLVGSLDAADVLTLDLARIAGDQTTRLFNNGEQGAVAAPPAAPDALGDGAATFVLNNMSAGDATGITIQHSSTNNNGILQNNILADVDAGVTTVGVTIAEGTNNDPRFNFTLTADSDGTNGNAANTVANVTLTDSDSESNTVRLTEFTLHTGAITLSGGAAGTFLNLDATANGYGFVTTGATGDATTVTAAALTANPVLAAPGQTQVSARDTAVSTVFNTAVGGELLVASSINASAEASDVIVRLGLSNSNVQLGTGNDTVIYAERAGITAATSGLTIQDTVSGGTGTDTIVLDGTGVMTLGASEWTNLSGIDVIRLAGVAGSTFTLRLTDQIIDQADAGNRLTIINNDGDLRNVAENAATINLRAVSASNAVTFVGANGDGAAAQIGRAVQTVVLNDVTANGNNILNGGDRDIITDYTSVGVGRQFANAAAANAAWTANLAAGQEGNNNVLQIFNTAEVTVGDLAQTRNFSTINFTNDQASVQTLNLTLDSTTVDLLVDASHSATSSQVETLTITATDNATVPTAFSTLNVQAGTVAAQFSLNVTGAGGADVIVSGLGADNIIGGRGADTINLGGDVAADTVRADEGHGAVAVGGVFTAVDTVTNFITATDTFLVSGAGTSVILGGAAAPQAAGTVFTATATATFNANGAVGGAFITGATAASLTTEANVIAAIGGFTALSETVGEEAYFVVQNTLGTQFGVYHFVSATADDVVTAGELELLGVVTHTGAVTAADFVFA